MASPIDTTHQPGVYFTEGGERLVCDGGLIFQSVQTIGMNDTTVVLTLVQGTPTGTLLTGNILYVDPEGNTEILKLPPEADCRGLVLFIENTGGETITLQNDAGGAVVTIDTTESAIATCNGTAWNGSTGVL